MRMPSRILVCLTLALAGAGLAAAASAAPKAPPKARYLVRSPHTPEGCLEALDAVKAMGKGALAKFEWGCKDGDHTGYAIVTAASADEALAIVPESIRPKAAATKLNRFTEAEVQKFHEVMQEKKPAAASGDEDEDEEDEP